MQLQEIDVPPAFAHRLELSVRARTRSQRLTWQNGQSIPIGLGPLHSPVSSHRLPKHWYWAATGIAVILVLAFTALVATYTGSLAGSPPVGSKPVENQVTSTVAATPQYPINDQIMQLHKAIIDLGTMVNDRRDDNVI